MSNRSKRQLRVYEPIWKQLKSTQRCVLEVPHAEAVGRIKRMIIKEKCGDIGFKLINEVERYNLRFEWIAEKKELVILLVSRFGLTDPVT